MSGQQECDLDLRAGDHGLLRAINQAGSRYRDIEPAPHDSTLDDPAFRMSCDRMTVTLFGAHFDHNAIFRLIVSDGSDAQ